jgi:hypothetical protein
MRAGVAVSHRDHHKQIPEPNGYGIVLLSIKSHGRLSQPAMKLLHLLGKVDAGPGDVWRASFVEGALRELSDGLG